MIRGLYRLRDKLPRAVWFRLKNAYWLVYWARELSRQRRELGAQAPSRLRGSERTELAERVADYYPFSALLEVGCAFGQNFHVLAPLFPDVEMLGIDPDEDAIAGGVELLQKKGIGNVTLSPGEGADLSRFPDNSIDLVISIACLLHVGATAIEDVTREMLRVSARGLLLVEQHEERENFPGQDKGTLVPYERGAGGYWVRDYRKLLEKFVPAQCISLRKIPHPAWKQEQWSRLGHLIEVKKGSC